MNTKFAAFSIFLLLITIESQAWEGKGSESNPYIISDCEQLVDLAQKVNKGWRYSNTYFKVTVPELDFRDINYTIIGDSESHPFSGILDGNGVVVKNIVINNNKNFTGLFGCVLHGFIKNITIDKSCCFIGNQYIGGIVAFSQGSTTKVTNCFNYAVVSGSKYVGGIAGDFHGVISNCYNYGDISCSIDNVGGIVAYSYGKIENCHNRGNVTGGGQKTGGIIGYTDFGELRNCTVASCSIAANSLYVGAVLGAATKTEKISDNYYNYDVIVITNGKALKDTTPRGCGNKGGPVDIIENNGAVLGQVIDNKLEAEENGNVDYGNSDEINDQTDLNGQVIGNIFYNIASGNGGYNSTEGCIVVNSPTNDDDINGKDIFGEYFKSHFTGIVFKVASGSGKIAINVETHGMMSVKIKIGNNAPFEMMVMSNTTMSFPYNVNQPTYVYIYGSSATSTRSGNNLASLEDNLKLYSLSWDSSTTVESVITNHSSIKSQGYHTIDGKYKNNYPTRKGLYIKNGKKIIM